MLKKGVAAIEGNYKRSSAFKSGKMTQQDLEKTMSLVQTSANVDDFRQLSDCDIVIEAVFESLDLKKSIFQKLDKVCKPSALLCTNTSYLSIDDIAAATKRPESVMGTHFFSPANAMKLLENVKGSKTSNESIATAMKMGKDIGKVAVLSGNAFGFIGNRLFESYCVEAMLMVEEGASPETIDNALGPRGFGMAMGPLAVLDLAGNDIGQRIRRESYYPYSAAKGVKGKRALSWMALADELCNQGRFGQKTQKGWYSYAGEDKRKGLVDPEVIEMARKHAEKHQIRKNDRLIPATIVDRCILSLANEGFRVLEEKIAARSSDIDVVWNYGYGFPRYRGGPMHYVDHVVGLKNMKEKMLRFLHEQPELPEWHFKPAPLLEQLVKEGKSLKQYEK
jgi:3-hydroxyacyl-CoA dehydrogenase